MIEFVIEGEPIAKARARTCLRGGFVRSYTPAKTANAETHIAKCFKDAYDKFDQLQCPLQVQITFEHAIPKSVSKKKRAEMVGKPCVKRPDVDNLAKLVLDALNGLCYGDDSQIYALYIVKMYSETPRTIVQILTENDG